MKQSQVGAWWVWALVAAVPLACGGSAMSDPGSSAVTAGAGGEGSTHVGAGNATAGAPASTVTAGAGGGNATSGAPSYGGVSSYGGESSYGGVHYFGPSCPTDIPRNGSACSVTTNAGNPCLYDPSNPCNTTLAICQNGAWQLAGYAIWCGPTGDGGAGGELAIDLAGGAGGDLGAAGVDSAIDLGGAAGAAR